jgi:pyruvate/2-oxoglutarate dehydrogenase complex dihydrolipoamide dehydrogenase (E3) component
VIVEPKSVEWATTLARKQAVIDKLAGGVTGLLKNRKVTSSTGGHAGRRSHRAHPWVDGESARSPATRSLASGSVPR